MGTTIKLLQNWDELEWSERNSEQRATLEVNKDINEVGISHAHDAIKGKYKGG